MNKILKKITAFVVGTMIVISQIPSFAAGTPYTVGFTGGPEGTQMSDGKVEFKRIGASGAGDKTGYYYSPLNTTGDFYVDLKLRVPKESTAAQNFSLSFATYKTAKGASGSWLIPFVEKSGFWQSGMNGETVKHKYAGNDWWTFRIVYSKGTDGVYTMTILNVNSKAEYETWRSEKIDASELKGWLCVNASDGTKGASFLDIAQFDVYLGSPEGDNSQLEMAKNFIEKPTFAEISNKSERAMYKNLYTLGLFDLMEDGTVHPGDDFTKKQLADSMVKLYGISSDDYTYEDLKYKDLTDSKAHKNCLIAVENGYMTAYNETLFGVNDKITYADMTDYMLKLLGYGSSLDFSDGTIGDRFKFAASLGIFKGTEAVQNKKVTRKNAAIIIDNVKDMRVMEPEIGSADNISFVNGSETVLNKYSNVYYEKNVMLDADNDTGIYSREDATEKGYVSIGGILYAVGEADMSELYLGTMLDVTYRYDEEENQRILINAEVKSTTTVTTIKDDELESISDTELSADIDGRVKRYKYNKPKVIYNRRSADTMISLNNLIGDLDKFRGTITFVDNNNGTDVLIIEQYTTAVVKGVDKVQKIIYDKYGNDIALTEDCYALLSVSNIKTELENLQINDVLTVMESIPDESGEVFKTIYYSRAMVKDSTVEKYMTTDGEKASAEINGTKYFVAMELVNAGAENEQLKLKNGLEADFLTDIYGNIAGFINVKQNYIGYVIKCKVVETDGENEVYIKVFNQEGTMEELYLNRDRCMVDGITQKSCEDQYEALTADETTIEQTVVKYKKNAKTGKVTMLDTVKKGAGGTNDTVVRVAKREIRKYLSTGSAYADKIGITSDAVKFKIPTPGTELFYDEAGYSLGMQASNDDMVNEAWSTDGEGVFTVNGVQLDAAIANVVITYSPINYSNNIPVLVTGIETVWNDKYDEEVTVVNGYVSNTGKYETYTIKSDPMFANNLSKTLKKGYVFSIARDSHNNVMDNIGGFTKLESPFNGGGGSVFVDERGNAVTKDAFGNSISSSLNQTFGSTANHGTRCVLGTVKYNNGEHLIINFEKSGAENYIVCGLNNSVVFEMTGEGSKVKIEESSIHSLNEGDKIFTYMSGTKAYMILVYR